MQALEHQNSDSWRRLAEVSRKGGIGEGLVDERTLKGSKEQGLRCKVSMIEDHAAAGMGRGRGCGSAPAMLR